MKRLKTFALLLALSAAPALAQGGDSAASVAGTWKVTGDVVGNPVELVCTFAQDGKKLTGSCREDGSDKANALTGEVDDKKVSWKFDTTFNGQGITLTLAGTLESPAKLKGGIDVQPYGVSGDFTAAKEEPKKEEKKPQQ
jgi:hypothetical protein